jgi:inorganic pyrophosphatase
MSNQSASPPFYLDHSIAYRFPGQSPPLARPLKWLFGKSDVKFPTIHVIFLSVFPVRSSEHSLAGILEWKAKPDYAACVSIVAKAALGEMRKPALFALLFPVTVGFVFRMIGRQDGRYLLGIEVRIEPFCSRGFHCSNSFSRLQVLTSFLIFSTLTALVMAIFFDNSGGAWDNAKKLIESQGQKGTDWHKAAVTGDTVGDPFKDTAGPALHVIITTMATTALVLGPLFLNSNKP